MEVDGAVSVLRFVGYSGQRFGLGGMNRSVASMARWEPEDDADA